MPTEEARAEREKASLRPRFSPDINYGHVLTALTILVGTTTGLMYAVERQVKIETRVDLLYADRAVNMDILNSLVTSQSVQDEKIKSLVEIARSHNARLDAQQSEITALRILRR